MNILKRIKEEYRAAINSEEIPPRPDSQLNEIIARVEELVEKGAANKALSAWEKHAELYKNEYKYWIAGCKIYFELEQATEAERAAWWALYNASEEDKAEENNARLMLAKTYKATGFKEKMEEQLKIAIKTCDTSGKARLEYAASAANINEEGRITLLAEAIAMDTRNKDAINELAMYIKKNGKKTEERVIKIIGKKAGNKEDAWLAEAWLIMALGRHQEAFRKATELIGKEEKIRVAYEVVAVYHLYKQKHKEAIENYRKAFCGDEESEEYLMKTGEAYYLMGEPKVAETLFRAAIKVAKSKTRATQNLAMTLLIQGNYNEGWKAYDSRFWTKEGRKYLNRPGIKKVESDTRIKRGTNILISHDQCLGDWLQFSRYILELEKRGARIILEIDSRLFRIAKSSFPKCDFKCLDEESSIETEYWSPLCRLPMVLEGNNKKITDCRSYLKINNAVLDYWEKKIKKASYGKYNIGIHWQGDISHEKTLDSKGRSLRLEELRILSDIEGINLVSLQRGEGSEQLAECSFRKAFIAIQSDLDKAIDFEDVGGIAKACDAIVTNDTAMAHLAGGLGIKTYLLLKKLPEWRWGLTGSKSDWYKSLILVRQQEWGNWQEAIKSLEGLIRGEVTQYQAK